MFDLLNIFRPFLIKTFFAVSVFLANTVSAGNYVMTIDNACINSHSLEFDLMIKSSNGSYSINSYQLILNINNQIFASSAPTFEYIPGTSNLSNTPIAASVKFPDKSIELSIGSGIGADLITTSIIRVGRFRLTDLEGFTDQPVNLSWDFSGINFTALFDEEFQLISSSDCHTSIEDCHISKDITDIHDNNSLPLGNELFQNYPNPFNPSTTIEFSLKTDDILELKIFDISGRMVQILFSGHKKAGKHKFLFTAETISSGIYFIRLTSNSGLSFVKKAVLLK